MALIEYPIDEIKKSFVEWVRTHAEMPTPADIISLVHSFLPQPKINYDRSSPEEYQRAECERKNPRRVAWFGKDWKNLSSEDRRALAVHLVRMGADRAENYAKYLHDYCKAPSCNQVFASLSVSFAQERAAG